MTGPSPRSHSAVRRRSPQSSAIRPNVSYQVWSSPWHAEFVRHTRALRVSKPWALGRALPATQRVSARKMSLAHHSIHSWVASSCSSHALFRPYQTSTLKTKALHSITAATSLVPVPFAPLCFRLVLALWNSGSSTTINDRDRNGGDQQHSERIPILSSANLSAHTSSPPHSSATVAEARLP